MNHVVLTTVFVLAANLPSTGTFAQDVNSPRLDNEATQGLLPAFPGALGFGRFAVGGRGGSVIVVNTVEDIVDPDDDRMSLREALAESTGPRTIVFDVGGVFEIAADADGLSRLTMEGESDSFVTLACQSAPAPGVVIKSGGIRITGGAHDIVMRHCKMRAIDEGEPASESGRNITVSGANTRDIIFDHMSLSWATDENFQVYAGENITGPITNITLSNSIVSEGDADSSHPNSKRYPGWFSHSEGPSCNVNSSRFRTERCSIVNNFIAHNSGRNGMIWGGSGELVNNIVYNWYNQGHTVRPQSGSQVDAHIYNNFFKRGPQTASNSDALYIEKNEDARIRAANNFYKGHLPFISTLDAVNWGNDPDVPNVTPWATDVVAMSREDSGHMRCVGASRPVRDDIDSRVIQEFHDGTGSIGIGSNQVPAGWYSINNDASHRQPDTHNVIQQRDFSSYVYSTAHPIDRDTDQDGIADDWEFNNALDPSNPDDYNFEKGSEGYTALEVYLNELAVCDNTVLPTSLDVIGAKLRKINPF